jgi:hypothetical protein
MSVLVSDILRSSLLVWNCILENEQMSDGTGRSDTSLMVLETWERGLLTAVYGGRVSAGLLRIRVQL